MNVEQPNEPNEDAKILAQHDEIKAVNPFLAAKFYIDNDVGTRRARVAAATAPTTSAADPNKIIAAGMTRAQLDDLRKANPVVYSRLAHPNGLQRWR